MVDPQEVIEEFGEWSQIKKYNFIVELTRELTDKQKLELAIFIASDIS